MYSNDGEMYLRENQTTIFNSQINDLIHFLSEYRNCKFYRIIDVPLHTRYQFPSKLEKWSDVCFLISNVWKNVIPQESLIK